MIVCGHHEVDGLQAELDARGGAPPGARAADELRWRRRDQRTAAVFSTGHSYFGRGRPSAYTEWLVTNFGRHAHAKRLPAWVFGMPEAWRAALLEGYLSADGHTGVRTQGAKTVSKELAFGVRLLAEGLGHRVGITVRSRR